MLYLFFNINGVRPERISKKNDGIITKTVTTSLYQDKWKNKDKPSSSNYSHPKPKKDVSLPDSVMKIKTVKPEKAIGIENSIIKAAQSGMLKQRLT